MKHRSEENLKTKQDFQKLLLDIVEPLKPYYSSEKAKLDLGKTSTHYDDETILMEAFARPLWGLVPYWAGGGQEGELEETYKLGLIAGTNPEGAEYWGKYGNFDQKFVEMAAIAYAILMTPEKVWDPLSDKEKNNLVDWLYGINDFECCDCNWQFFNILVNVVLKVKGYPYSEEKMQYGLSRIDAYYIDHGWYEDGDSGQKDYYISFAIHFYSLIYSSFMKEYDPERCELYRDRAKKFATEFIYWFSDEGAALPYGRSLTYRFAQVSFFSLCVYAGIDAFPVEVYKGIIVRHFVDWFKTPIFDRAGIMTIGYRYPNLHMSESYNAPGSPYWSMKAFMFLALPDDHEFWKVEAVPMPKLEKIKTLKSADMVIQRLPHQVTMYTPGCYAPNTHVHVTEKYSKFAYSTYFGFSIPRSNRLLKEAAPDSMLAFEIDGYIFVKHVTTDRKIENDILTFRWSPFQGVEVDTELIPTKDGHIRKHRIQSEYSCVAYDCGFAVCANDFAQCKTKSNKNEAIVGNKFSSCTVINENEKGEGYIISAVPNTNLNYSKTEIPAIKYQIEKGENAVISRVINEVY